MFKKPWMVLFCYLLAGFALYGPFLDNPFLMDDEIQITGNPHIQNLSEWPNYFTSSTMDSGGGAHMGGIYYKPLMTSFYAVVWHFFPNSPAADRSVLLFLHVLSAWFLFLIISQFFDFNLSSLAGILFLVHPVNSEIVAYLADAQDALYLFFGLISLWLAQHLESKMRIFFSLSITFALALLSKETGALFLGIVPLYLFLFRRDKLWPAVLSSALVAAFYLWVRSAVGLMHLENPILVIVNASWLERLQTLPITLWHYIEVFVFPLRISLITDFVVKEIGLENFWLPLLGGALFVGSLVALYRNLKTTQDKKLFYFCTGTLIAWLILHGNIFIPLDGTYADRWLYLANLPFFLLIFLALKKYGRLSSNKIFLSAVALVCCLLGARTWQRLEEWRDPISLYRHEYELHPFNYLIANNVGVELFRRGDINGSEFYFKSATDLNPAWDVAWNNWGAVAQRQQKIDQALALYSKAVSLGGYALAYENYAGLLCATGQIDKCRRFLNERALPYFPNNSKLREIENALKAQP